MIARYTAILLLLMGSLLFGQGAPVKVRFALTVGGEPLVIGQEYALQGHEGVVLEALRFYVSDLQLWNKGQVVGESEARFHLVDANVPGSLLLNCKAKEGLAFDQISFQLGIDSLTNVSGAMGGDLDPTLGMYWAWQSGYINFKLEGNAPHCPARNHFFQFHLGGYLPPYYALQRVTLPLSGETSGEIVVAFAVDEWLARIDLSESYEVMRPCERAVELSGWAAQAFKVLK